jgi:hypothetical protein
LTIETKVALVVRGIPEKNVEGGAGRKFVGGSGRQVGITGATKNTEMLI